MPYSSLPSLLPTEPQRLACLRVGVSPSPLAPEDRIAFARGLDPTAPAFSLIPLNGLRHPPHGNMCGWYLWAGEDFSTARDCFSVIHYAHILAAAPPFLPYLALPAGWRFLIAPGHEDVWRDDSLLSI